MSADASEAPRGPMPDDCVGPRLDSLRAVRREIAVVYRLLKQRKVTPGEAHVMVTVLSKQMDALIDKRDSVWLPRVKELWRDREAAKVDGANAGSH